MLKGRCSGINESQYFAWSNSATQTITDAATMTAVSLGLALNILSLVVFLRVFRRSNNRNNFHLFLVFLSACEVAFCLTSAVAYTSMSILSKKGRYSWAGLESGAANATEHMFVYAMFLPSTSELAATVYYNSIILSTYLAVVSQMARNCWVATTALLRCYVATRRTSVQVNQVYSIRRISLIFSIQLATVVGLSLVRSYLNHRSNAFNFDFHSCNISEWDRSGSLLLQVTQDQARQRMKVNMMWTLLSQIIPLCAIIASSILLVHSLRSHGMVDSSERNKRITRMVVIFSLAFTLLECPRAVVFLIFSFVKLSKWWSHMLLTIMQISYVLSLTDSSVNVFIYFFNDQHFKKELCYACSWLRPPAGSKSCRMCEINATVDAAPAAASAGDNAEEEQEDKPESEAEPLAAGTETTV